MTKICCLIASYAPSLVIFRGDLIKSLQQQGYEVHCFAPNADDDTQDSLTSMGCHYVDLPLARAGTNPLADLKTLWFLYCTFKEIKPDITLAYTIKPVIYSGIAARFAKVPKRFSLVTGLGYAFNKTSSTLGRLAQWLLHKLYQYSFTCVDKVICQHK